MVEKLMSTLGTGCSEATDRHSKLPDTCKRFRKVFGFSAQMLNKRNRTRRHYERKVLNTMGRFATDVAVRDKFLKAKPEKHEFKTRFDETLAAYENARKLLMPYSHHLANYTENWQHLSENAEKHREEDRKLRKSNSIAIFEVVAA